MTPKQALPMLEHHLLYFLFLNRITVYHLLPLNTEKPYHIMMKEKWITFSVDYALLIGMKNLSSSLLFIKCFLHQQGLPFSRFHKKASVDRGSLVMWSRGWKGKLQFLFSLCPHLFLASKSTNPSMENGSDCTWFFTIFARELMWTWIYG